MLYIHPNCNQGATSILSSSLIAHGPTVPGREPWLLCDAVSVFSWTFCVVWFIGLAACHERKNRMNYAVWTIFDCKEVSQMSSSRPDAPNLHRPSPTSPPESRHLPSRWRGCWLSDRTARQPAPAGVWKSQKSSHPPLHFNTTTTVSTQNLNQRQFNRQVKICFSQRIVVAHPCEHQYGVYYTSVSVYMTVYESYERTAYWLLTVNEYAKVNSFLSPHTRRASGSVRYCWKLWSEIVASGLCPKASCFYLSSKSQCRVHLARNFGV